MNRKLILAGIFILLLGTFARAVDIEGSCSFTAYQCELGKVTLNACNDRDYDVTYFLTSEGPEADWLSVVPEEFTLGAQECRTMTVFMSSACYADPGTYYSEIVVKGEGEARITCDMDIKQGHLVDVRVEPESRNATQCEAKEYQVLINNESILKQETEPLNLEVTGLPAGWAELEDTEVFVSTGQEESVTLVVSPPCDAELGNYPFTVEAVSKVNPNFRYAGSAELNLVQGQKIGIESEQLYSACREEDNAFSFKVRNNGKLADNVRLELEAPAWLSLEKENLSLEAGAEEEVTVRAEKTGEEAGTYMVRVRAVSDYDYETYADFEVDLEDCYSISIKKVSGEASVCTTDSVNYVFEVSNTGSKTMDISLSLSGIDASLDSAQLSLGAGKSATINAELDVSAVSGRIEAREVFLKAESRYETAEKGFALEVRKCNDIVISMPELNLCRGITAEAEIEIDNRGTSDQTVALSLTPSWAELAGSTVDVISGKTVRVKVIMAVPKFATEKEAVLSAEYNGIEEDRTAGISYGSQTTCFGLALNVEEKELDAAKCRGKTQAFTVENKGVTGQNITLKANLGWVYFEEESLYLEAGEKKTSYFVIVPPIDVKKGIYEINILAESEFGTLAHDKVKLSVFGPEFGKEPIDVNVHDLNVMKIIENIAVDVEFSFWLLNDSNRTARIHSITSPTYESAFIPAKEIVKSMERVEVTAYLDLPENYDKNFVVMNIDVNTDEGLVTKNLRFNLVEGGEGQGNMVVPLGGLFTLENFASGGLMLLILMIAALIVYTMAAKPKKKGAGRKKSRKKKAAE
jgi:uncharacterized membrane protein